MRGKTAFTSSKPIRLPGGSYGVWCDVVPPSHVLGLLAAGGDVALPSSLSLHASQVPSSPQYFPAGTGSPHSREIFGSFGISALTLQLEPEQNPAFLLCQQHLSPWHMWGSP